MPAQQRTHLSHLDGATHDGLRNKRSIPGTDMIKNRTWTILIPVQCGRTEQQPEPLLRTALGDARGRAGAVATLWHHTTLRRDGAATHYGSARRRRTKRFDPIEPRGQWLRTNNFWTASTPNSLNSMVQFGGPMVRTEPRPR